MKEISKGRLSVKELVDKHGEGYLEGLKDNLISKNIHIKKSEDGTYSILHTDPKTGKVSEIEQRVPNNKPQQPENKELDLKILAENDTLKESVSEVSGCGDSKNSFPRSQSNLDVPDKAYNVLEIVKKQNGAPPRNHKSHKYLNKDNKLPEGDYKMYDVNPKPPNGIKRDSERIVIDSKTGKAHYSNSHYTDFIPMN